MKSSRKNDNLKKINSTISTINHNLGLSPKKYRKYEIDILQKITDHINNDKPVLEDIINSNVSFSDKCILVEKLNILNNMNINTMEYFTLKKQLNKMLEENVFNNKTDVKDFDKKESELSKVIIKNSLKKRILLSNMNKDNMAFIYEKYKHLELLDPSNPEYAKLYEWIEWALSIPQNRSISKDVSINDGNIAINNHLLNIKKHLDKYQYGNNKAKNELIMYICNRITNPEVGNNLALLGPPGVGKTSLIEALAEAKHIPLYKISLGGIKDSSFLSGHGYTYEGSLPGMIVQALKKMGCKDGIIYFDELDKIEGQEVIHDLLHIVDSVQNKEFNDKYLRGFDIDLSNIWFIYSLNKISTLGRPLFERIPMITLEKYNLKDKIEIFKRHLLPNALIKAGMDKTNIDISNDDIVYLINKSDETKNEAGVRVIKNVVESIIRKVNILRCCILDDGTTGDLEFEFYIKDFSLPLRLNRKNIDILYQDQTNSEWNSMYV